MAGGRRAPIPSAAASRIQERRAAIGNQVGDARLRRHWTQAQLAAKAGVGRMVVARVERGKTRVDIEVLERLALALELHLTVELGRDRRQEVEDAGHLAMQELVLRLGRLRGFVRQFELATRPAEPWRSVDVYLGSPAQRVAIDVECWNTFGDVGNAARSSVRKVAELEQRAIAVWGATGRAALVWVVRDTAANRHLVAKYPEVFTSKFPGSSARWVAALTNGGEIPKEPGLVWCDLKATRLFAWRRPRAA